MTKNGHSGFPIRNSSTPTGLRTASNSVSKPLPEDPDSLANAIRENLPKSRTTAAPSKQSMDKSRRGSTVTIKSSKSQKISSKRTSTQTIASMYHPEREKIEKSRKGKAAKMMNMIPSMPKLPRVIRGNSSEHKFSFSMRNRGSSISTVARTASNSISSITRPQISPEPNSGRPQFSPEPISTRPQMSPEPTSRTPQLSPEPILTRNQLSPEPVLDPTKSADGAITSAPRQSPQIALNSTPIPEASPQLSVSSFSMSPYLESSETCQETNIVTQHVAVSNRPTSDSLAPLSPLTYASSRPTSQSSQLSSFPELDTLYIPQQATNTTTRERPRVIEVRTKHGVSPSISNEPQTPLLSSMRFDPSMPGSSSRTASPTQPKERGIDIDRAPSLSRTEASTIRTLTPLQHDMGSKESPVLGLIPRGSVSAKSHVSSRSASPYPESQAEKASTSLRDSKSRFARTSQLTFDESRPTSEIEPKSARSTESSGPGGAKSWNSILGLNIKSITPDRLSFAKSEDAASEEFDDAASVMTDFIRFPETVKLGLTDPGSKPTSPLVITSFPDYVKQDMSQPPQIPLPSPPIATSPDLGKAVGRPLIKRKPLPPSASLHAPSPSVQISPLQVETSFSDPKSGASDVRSESKQSPVGHSQLRHINTSHQLTEMPLNEQSNLEGPSSAPTPPRKNSTFSGLDSYAPPDSAYATNFSTSMTDLLGRESPGLARPATSRDTKPGARFPTKLGLFPVPTPTFSSLRAAQSHGDLHGSYQDDGYVDDGVGEEAESALPVPTLLHHRSRDGGRKLTVGVFKKFIGFNKR
jgi:hypothetical protein